MENRQKIQNGLDLQHVLFQNLFGDKIIQNNKNGIISANIKKRPKTKCFQKLIMPKGF